MNIDPTKLTRIDLSRKLLVKATGEIGTLFTFSKTLVGLKFLNANKLYTPEAVDWAPVDADITDVKI